MMDTSASDTLLAGLLIIAICLCVLAGVHRVKENSQKVPLQEQINQLKLENESLKRICAWEEILEQTLSPLCQAELDLKAEQIRQEKQNINLRRKKN